MGCILNICKKFAECEYAGVMDQAPAKQTNERGDNLATTSFSSDPVTGLAAWAAMRWDVVTISVTPGPSLPQLTALGCLSQVSGTRATDT